MYSGHKVWKLGNHKFYIFDLFFKRNHKLDRMIWESSCKRKSNILGRNGLAAASSHHKQFEWEERGEYWELVPALFTLIHTEDLLCNRFVWEKVCVAWGKEESNTFTGIRLKTRYGTRMIPVTRPPRPWDEEQGMLIVFDDKIRWNLRVWTL